MTTIFISYAHEDVAWREDLESYLRILALNDERLALEIWSDQQLSAGDDWEARINAIMERASLALLIVTKNFLASEFISREELPYLEKRARDHDLGLLPVLAEPCPWQAVRWLSQLQLYPAGDRPLSSLSKNDQNEELTRLLNQIRERVGSGAPLGRERTLSGRVPTTPVELVATGEGATLEVSLRHHRAAQYYFSEIRYSDPGSPTHDRALAYTARLGPVAVGSSSEETAAYAAVLERRIFPPGPAQEVLLKAHQASGGRPLKLRVGIDPTASDLHELCWETLASAPTFVLAPHATEIIFTRYVSPGEESWPKPQIRSWPKEIGVVLIDRCLEACVAEHESYAEAFKAQGLKCERLAAADPLAAADSFAAAITMVSVDLFPDPFAIRLSWAEDGGAVMIGAAEDAVASLRRYLGGSQILILDTLASAGETEDRAAHSRASLSLAADAAAAGFCAVVTCAASLDADAWRHFLELFLSALARSGNIDRAAHEARAGLPPEDAWKPAVLSRLRTGQIWLQPTFVGNGDSSWDLVVERIKEGSVVPILGPGLSEYLVRSRQEIAEQMAEQCHFPLARSDRSNLRQVAQYVATTQEPARVVRQFISAIRTYTTERYGKAVEGLSADGPLENNLERLWHKVLAQRADDPFRLVARMRCPVYLTTAVHPFLSLAIGDHLRDGGGGAEARALDRILTLDEGILGAEEDCDELGLTLDRDRPLAYYLFGRVDRKSSLVLTQDDHFRFLLNFKEQWHSLPPAVVETFSDSALLFLGFDLNSWDFRAIFRAFLELEGRNQLRKIPHLAVQINPDDDRLADPGRTRAYLVEYFKQISEKPLVFLGSAQDFLSELDRRCPP